MKNVIILLLSFIIISKCFTQTIGAKVSLVAVDGKTYTGKITEMQGDKYKVKYDGFDFDAWLTTEQFQVVESTPPAPATNREVNKQPQKVTPGNSTSSNGKLYFRTMSWYSSYGITLDLNWIFLGNDGTFVRDPKNGVNPINYAAELQNNADNVGKYKIEGKKLYLTLNKNRTATWGLEYNDKGEISAMDAGLVTRPKAMPANYTLNGQYAASAVLPNVSSVHTLVFSHDGTFTLNKQGAVSTSDMSAISKSDSKGTYKITGNTLWLNFDNGETHTGTIWIWELDKGKRNLVINRSYFPQER